MPLPPGIRVVAFDAVGTLIAPNPSAAETYAAVAQTLGLSLDVATIHSRFWAELERQDQIDAGLGAWHTSEKRERDRWRQIVKACLREAPDPTVPFETLWQHFAQPENWQVFADVAPTWKHLADQGVKIVIASNFDARLEGLVASLLPLQMAEKAYFSAAIGYRKPAPEFFTAIEKGVGCDPSELLMVGDDEDNDLLAAQRRGWHATLIDRSGRKRGRDVAVGNVLERLDELLQ